VGIDEQSLRDWQRAERLPLNFSNDPKIQEIILAARHGERMRIVYYGGTTPGARRSIWPMMVFPLAEYHNVYIDAYCEARSARRTFRVDRLEIVGTHGYQVRSPVVPPAKRDASKGNAEGYGCSLLLFGIIAVIIDFLFRNW